MIAAWRQVGESAQASAPILRALALHSDGSAIPASIGAHSMASAPPSGSMGCEPPLSRDGRLAVFDGWIDEAPCITGSSDTQRYLAALDRWGDAAEARICGHYASALWEADGTLRLARSPWRAPPLHYASGPDGPVAASVLRALFAAGVAKRLDRNRLVDALYFDAARTEPGSWYHGIRAVPLGSILRIRPDGKIEIDRWYDPHALSADHQGMPQDWLEEARALLAEAGRLAAGRAARPALLLSGGLDSPLAAAAVLGGKPAGCRPFAVTARPDAEWDGRLPPGYFADEADFAHEFCARHALEHVTTRAGGFDQRLDDFYRATDMTTMQIGNAGPLYGLWEAAKAHGGDWVFDAVIGNDTLSSDAPWAYAEELRGGRIGPLLAGLARRPGDTRSLARKFAALAVLPLLPDKIQHAVRQRLSDEGAGVADIASPLRQDIIAAEGLAERARAARGPAGGGAPDRRRHIDFAWEASDSGLADLNLGFEQLYGLRHRDVLAYRPLVEFALRLPARAFVNGGVHRWLARALLAGIVPDRQRLNPDYGAHNVDWLVHMTRRRERLTAQLAAIAHHPVLGELVDVTRLQALINAWPERTPLGRAGWPLQQGLLNAYCLSRFVGHVEGRNDL